MRGLSAPANRRSLAHGRVFYGDRKLSQGRYETAIKAYTSALRQDPDNARAYSGRAAANWRLGRGTDALRDLDDAFERDPNDARAHMWRGRAGLDVQSQITSALQHFEAVRRHAPGDFNARLGVAHAHVKRDRDDEAAPILDELLREVPTHADVLLLRSDLLVRAGNAEAALEDIETLLTGDPDNANALARRGNLCLQLGDGRAAARDFARVARRTPEMGRQLEQQPGFRQALDTILETFSGDPDAGLFQGDVLRHKRYWDIAAQRYTKVLQHDPNNADAYAGRADVNLDRGGEAYRRIAHHDIRNALRLDANNPLALLARAEYLRTGGHLVRAADAYDDAIDAGAGARAIVGLARVSALLGSFREALRTLRELRDEDLGLFCRERGFVFLAWGKSYGKSLRLHGKRTLNFRKAFSEFNNALHIASRSQRDDTLALAGRGEARRKLRRFKSALADYGLALRLNPFDVETYRLASVGQAKAKRSLKRAPWQYFVH